MFKKDRLQYKYYIETGIITTDDIDKLQHFHNSFMYPRYNNMYSDSSNNKYHYPNTGSFSRNPGKGQYNDFASNRNKTFRPNRYIQNKNYINQSNDSNVTNDRSQDYYNNRHYNNQGNLYKGTSYNKVNNYLSYDKNRDNSFQNYNDRNVHGQNYIKTPPKNHNFLDLQKVNKINNTTTFFPFKNYAASSIKPFYMKIRKTSPVLKKMLNIGD